MTKDWKYYLGLVLFAYSFAPLVVVGCLPLMGMSLAESGALAVVFLATGEIAFYGAAVLLGKEFLVALKRRLHILFRRPAAPPRPVGRTRHRLGVAVIAASFLTYYAVLIDLLFFSPAESEVTFLAWSLVGGEAMSMAGLFLLGGQFWERLRHIFDWPGPETAVQPPA